MGLTTVAIEIANLADPERTITLDLLVDSGAVYSVIPASILDQLGIKSLATLEFRLADGSRISRRKGGAVFKRGEQIGVADVIFGEEGDQNLLGAMTLEALGLSLDPLRRELKPLPMLL